MDRRLFVTALAGVATSPFQRPEAGRKPSVRSELLGAWSLLDAFTIAGDEVKPWFGRTPPLTGILMYLDNGCVSAQISGARPTMASREDFLNLPIGDRAKWLNEYYSYYGTFEVDDAAKLVIHHIRDSLLPYEVGTVYRRKFELENGVLTLITEPRQDRGQMTFNRLIWKKIP